MDHSSAGAADGVSASDRQPSKGVGMEAFSDDHDSDSDEEGPTRKRKADVVDPDDELVAGIEKKGKAADSESEGEEGEDVFSNGEDDDEDEDKNEYEEDGFVVMGGGEEEDDDEGKKTKREKTQLKRLKKNVDKVVLDEEDFELVRENIEDEQNQNQMKDDTGGAESDEDEKMKEYEGERVNEGVYQREEADEMDDFIDDGDEDKDQDGVDETKSERKGNAPVSRARGFGPSMDEVQESMDIFGIENFDLDGLDEEDLEDEEDGNILAQKRGEDKIAKLRSRIERQVLVDNFYTDKDEEIRMEDIPERYHDIMIGRDCPQEDERQKEGEWMAKKLADIISREPASSFYIDSLVEPIVFVLKCIQVDRLEIPFIWTYRKDYLHPDMQRNHLWTILNWDEKWESAFVLRSRLLNDIDSIFKAFEYSSENFEEMQAHRNSEILHLTGMIADHKRLVINLDEELTAVFDSIDNDHKNDIEVEPERLEKGQELKKQLEQGQEELKNTEDLLKQKKLELEKQYEYSLSLAQYTPQGISEVQNAFPRIRYDPIISESHNEQEIKDVGAFLSVLLKGAMKSTEREIQKEATGATGEEGEDGDVSMADVDGGGSADAKSEETPKVVANTVSTAPSGRKKKHINFTDKMFNYTRFRRIPNFRELIEKIFVSAADMGDSLRNGMLTECPPTPTVAVEDLYGDYIDGKIAKSVADIRNALVVVMAQEIAAEPNVKEAVRMQYLFNCTLSTRPTTKGVTDITPFHELFGIHWLEGKSLMSLNYGPDKTLYPRLVQAQTEGLLKIYLTCPRTLLQSGEWGPTSLDPFLLNAQLTDKFFPSADFSMETNRTARQELDILRYDVLEKCLRDYLLPAMETELKRELLRAGKEAIIEESANNFTNNMLSIGPHVPSAMTNKEFVTNMLLHCPYRAVNATVCSLHIGYGARQPLCMVYLDREGVLLASDYIPAKAAAQKKETLIPAIMNFVRQHKPDVLILNSSGGFNTKSMKNLLEKNVIPGILKEIEDEKANKEMNEYSDDEDDDDKAYSPEIMILKDEISEIFKQSERAAKLFPDFDIGLRAAVCLGRFAQEPLAEYCNLWTSANSVGQFGFEALFLKIHPHMHLVKSLERKLLTALERQLVNAVCDVGVDINASIQHEHTAAMLAFVGGLGLRKADAVRATIREKLKHVYSRVELLEKRVMKLNVWTNCIGFLKVDTEIGAESQSTNPFDSTRIHPECYHQNEWAPKICANALDNDDWGEGQDYQEMVADVKKNARDQLEKKIVEGRRPAGISKAFVDMWDRAFQEMRRPVLNVWKYTEQVKTAEGNIEAREKPCELTDKMSNLLLGEYCDQLEAKGEGKHALQFDQIKEELRYPWIDMRKRLQEPSSDEMFTIITGESDTSCHVGLKLGCEVLEIEDKQQQGVNGETTRYQRAFVKCDNGLKGTINMREVSDDEFDQQNTSIEDFIKTGSRIMAIVIAVQKDRYALELSIKPSLLETEEDFWIKSRHPNQNSSRAEQQIQWKISSWFSRVAKKTENMDQLYDRAFLEEDACELYAKTIQKIVKDNLQLQVQGASSGKQSQRHVQHELFVNCSHKEAEDKLITEQRDGNVIIRPSSKGPNNLSITWAFDRDRHWFVHFDVEEKGKEPGSLGLGKELIILFPGLTESYEDLDEIYHRFIYPMNELVQNMLDYKKFKTGTKQEVKDELIASKKADVNKIPFAFRFDPDRPGSFVLCFCSNINSKVPVREHVLRVTPDGYRMRHILSDEYQQFEKPKDIISMLKEVQRGRVSSSRGKISGNGNNNQPQPPQAMPKKSRFSNA